MIVEIQTVTSSEKYAKAFYDLKLEFHSRFTDFRTNDKLFNLFSISFPLSVEENMRMDLH